MSSALKIACEKLRQQELERQRRKECEILKAQMRPPRRPKYKRTNTLEKWQYYIRQRRKLSRRIMKRTGKNPAQILLNCSGATEKFMIQRLLDQAERLSPENQWRKEVLLQHTTRCGLEITLPDERSLRRVFSVYGLPEVIKTESQSTCCIQRWFKSKIIVQRLQEKKLDIFNVLKHFPDVDALQVVGKPVKIYTQEELEAAGLLRDSTATRESKTAMSKRRSTSSVSKRKTK